MFSNFLIHLIKNNISNLKGIKNIGLKLIGSWTSRNQKEKKTHEINLKQIKILIKVTSYFMNIKFDYV